MVDPRVELGAVAPRPAAVQGWGWIPDQYGTESYQDVDE
jgi:hypothetical protein